MGKKSHTWHVLNDSIKLAKYSDEPVELILASIFHDIGNKLCRLRKIVESELKDNPDLKDLAYAFRIEHQFWGMLETIKILRLIGFKPDTILNVIEMVGRHDLWKVVEDIELSEQEKLLREADVHWTLTDDGIARDIERAKENGLKPMSPQEQRRWNEDLFGKYITHKEVIEEC